MQDTVDAIAHLATSMASNRGTLTAITVTNAKLDLQMETA
jgi:hypothetical protein